jgi:hypothetical protein
VADVMFGMVGMVMANGELSRAVAQIRTWLAGNGWTVTLGEGPVYGFPTAELRTRLETALAPFPTATVALLFEFDIRADGAYQVFEITQPRRGYPSSVTHVRRSPDEFTHDGLIVDVSVDEAGQPAIVAPASSWLEAKGLALEGTFEGVFALKRVGER